MTTLRSAALRRTKPLTSGGVCAGRRQQPPPSPQPLLRNATRSMSADASTRRAMSTLPVHDDEDEDFEHGGEVQPAGRRRKRRQQKYSPIYVAATRQHVGKTSVSLALMSGLTKRFPASPSPSAADAQHNSGRGAGEVGGSGGGGGGVGFLKPVGQQCVLAHSTRLSSTIRVDKDAYVMRSRYPHLQSLDVSDMSPVMIPQGYTKRFIDGEIDVEDQYAAIEGAYERISDSHDVTVCEGTGHCAVGSVVGASNAAVAERLGAKMVLVANGGLGKTFDELELNKILCERHNVDIAGVIINKVTPSKYVQTKRYLSRILQDRWDVPLLGVVPDMPYLGRPALSDLERLFHTTLLSGEHHRYRHYDVDNVSLVATDLLAFLDDARSKPPRTLYISHVTRDDVVLGFLAEHRRRLRRNLPSESALLVCGRKDKYELSHEVSEMILDASEGRCGDAPPIFVATCTTREAMDAVRNFTPKMRTDDLGRMECAVEHYEPHLDFDLLLDRTKLPSSSEEEEKELV